MEFKSLITYRYKINMLGGAHSAKLSEKWPCHIRPPEGNSGVGCFLGYSILLYSLPHPGPSPDWNVVDYNS